MGKIELQSRNAEMGQNTDYSIHFYIIYTRALKVEVSTLWGGHIKIMDDK